MAVQRNDKVEQRAFICYSSNDSEFVLEVIKHMKHSFGDGIFYYEERQRSDEPFVGVINRELKRCNIMIVFSGIEFSAWQKTETQTMTRYMVDDESRSTTVKRNFCHILISGRKELPEELQLIGGYPIIKTVETKGGETFRVAKEIVLKLGLKWISGDDLPINPHLFSYEKDIINFYINKFQCDKGKGEPLKFQEKIQEGCPEKWPEVVQWKEATQDNTRSGLPLSEVGSYRAEDAKVVAAALTRYHYDCMVSNRLCFPEAGPREFLYYPIPEKKSGLKIGILVSGGIAPGINAVIDGITQRHDKYATGKKNSSAYKLEIFGYKNGFRAFEALADSTIKLTPLETSKHASEGGSILGTSRDEELLDIDTREIKLRNIISQLYNNHIKILYIIGGDGSMKAAHAIWSYAIDYAEKEKKDYNLSVVAIPKTMDNDILWMWQSFGFLSAVEKARQVIEELAVEVKSNPRLGVVQLFGSDSGFVVSHAVFANRTGICDAALIPESDFSIEGLATHLKEKMCKRSEELNEPIPYGLVVMAETAIPTDSQNYINDEEIGLSENEKQAVRDFDKRRMEKKRIEGQTDDFLRTAGLKIVSRGLYKLLYNEKIPTTFLCEPQWKKLRVLTNEPRHLLRAITPSSSDIIMAHRLGTLAVDNAMAGYTDFMISQWLTEYVLVPLKLVVLGRKRIPETGIFWKSVLAKTGQPAKL